MADGQAPLALGLSGGVAGAIAKTAVAPLERVRILAQTGQSGSSHQIFLTVVRKEGVLALWRGNTANVVRMVPSKCILLACSDLYQDFFRAQQLSAFARGGIAGACAGATSILCTYPLDLARTRMAGFVVSAGMPKHYETVVGTLRVIAREEGALGLFRGITPTLLGSFPYEGIKFGCYAALKRNARDDRQSSGWKAIFGALSATIANICTYPNDVVRRRLQLQGPLSSSRSVVYSGYFDCVRKVVLHEGWTALYRGLGLTIVRAIPNTGIQFGVYELCKEMLASV